jgi:hypothetical protein
MDCEGNFLIYPLLGEEVAILVFVFVAVEVFDLDQIFGSKSVDNVVDFANTVT